MSFVSPFRISCTIVRFITSSILSLKAKLKVFRDEEADKDVKNVAGGESKSESPAAAPVVDVAMDEADADVAAALQLSMKCMDYDVYPVEKY